MELKEQKKSEAANIVFREIFSVKHKFFHVSMVNIKFKRISILSLSLQYRHQSRRMEIRFVRKRANLFRKTSLILH